MEPSRGLGIANLTRAGDLETVNPPVLQIYSRVEWVVKVSVSELELIETPVPLDDIVD
jgi:hypothetical protein